MGSRTLSKQAGRQAGRQASRNTFAGTLCPLVGSWLQISSLRTLSGRQKQKPVPLSPEPPETRMCVCVCVSNQKVCEYHSHSRKGHTQIGGSMYVLVCLHVCLHINIALCLSTCVCIGVLSLKPGRLGSMLHLSMCQKVGFDLAFPSNYPNKVALKKTRTHVKAWQQQPGDDGRNGIDLRDCPVQRAAPILRDRVRAAPSWPKVSRFVG